MREEVKTQDEFALSPFFSTRLHAVGSALPELAGMKQATAKASGMNGTVGCDLRVDKSDLTYFNPFFSCCPALRLAYHEIHKKLCLWSIEKGNIKYGEQIEAFRNVKLKAESNLFSSGLQRLLAAAGLLCILYALSYWLMGRGAVSIYNPGENLFNTVFAPVALGPVFLLWQVFRYRRLEPAVILFNAYGGGWLLLVIVAENTTLGLVFYLLFLPGSLFVFLYATILLSQEIRSRNFAMTTIVATIITLFASGQVLVDAALVPFVI